MSLGKTLFLPLALYPGALMSGGRFNGGWGGVEGGNNTAMDCSIRLGGVHHMGRRRLYLFGFYDTVKTLLKVEYTKGLVAMEQIKLKCDCPFLCQLFV